MNRALLARSGLSLDRLGGYLAVVDAGGISAAAAGDPVRQSQLSRQLKELEEFFGGTLIERRRRRFQLTDAGRELVDVVRTTLARLTDLERRGASQPREVHLGAGESVLAWYLLPRLRDFVSGREPVALTLHNLRSQDILTRLRDGRLDLGIVRRSQLAAGFRALALSPVEYALFAPRQLLGRRARVDLPALLVDLPIAMLDGEGELNQVLATWAETQGLSLQIRLRCTSMLQAAEAVKHLRLGAVLPVWATTTLAGGQFVRLSLPVLKSVSAPLSLVWSKRQAGLRPFLVPLAKTLADRLTRTT